MDYENYAKRIKPLIHFKAYEKPKTNIKDVVIISVKKGEMTTHKIKKNFFRNLTTNVFIFRTRLFLFPLDI